MSETSWMPKRAPQPRPRFRMRYDALGWFALIGGAVLLAMTPIAIYPYFNPGAYQEKQNEIREKAGIKQEDIQPGGMNIWSDPFGPLPDRKPKHLK